MSMWAILNEKRQCSTIGIPSKAGDFHIVPLFMFRADAETCLAALPPAERSISEVYVLANGMPELDAAK